VVGEVGVKSYVLRELSITEPCKLWITYVYACKNGEWFFRQPDGHVGNEDIWYLEEGDYIVIEIYKIGCRQRSYKYYFFILHVDERGEPRFNLKEYGWVRTISDAVDRVMRTYKKMKICED